MSEERAAKNGGKLEAKPVTTGQQASPLPPSPGSTTIEFSSGAKAAYRDVQTDFARALNALAVTNARKRGGSHLQVVQQDFEQAFQSLIRKPAQGWRLWVKIGLRYLVAVLQFGGGCATAAGLFQWKESPWLFVGGVAAGALGVIIASRLD